MPLVPCIVDRIPTGFPGRSVAISLSGDVIVQNVGITESGKSNKDRFTLTVTYPILTEDEAMQLSGQLIAGGSTYIAGYNCVPLPFNEQSITPKVHPYGDDFVEDLKLWTATIKYWVLS